MNSFRKNTGMLHLILGRQSIPGVCLSIILELGLGYLLISTAIDTGSLSAYALTILLFILFIRDGRHLFRAIRQKRHDKN